MRLIDLLYVVPLLITISIAMGAVGRRDPGEISRASVQSFTTLVSVLIGVAVVVRLLIVFFV